MTTYKKTGMSKNLLKNPKAKHGFDHWEIKCSGGDGFDCEKIPILSKPFLVNSTSKDSLPCWATSYELDEKFQLVDLLKNGFRHEDLDNEKPPITVRDWFTPRVDCECVYKLNARLLGNDKTTELVTWNYSDTKRAGADWEKVEHVFVNYPPGVRYVEFAHGGMGTKWWKGHYGAKMTNAGVFVGVASENLIKNPCAEFGLEDWDVMANGGDGFLSEKAHGMEPLVYACPGTKVNSCWSTSYKNCQKKQLVDLCKHGFDAGLMDDVKPEIKISEWYGSRSDACMVYWLTIRLLDRRMHELDKREFKDSKTATGKWFHVTESFTRYPKGVRFIEYMHGGRDNCNWMGHYGAKITYSSVVIEKSH